MTKNLTPEQVVLQDLIDAFRQDHYPDEQQDEVFELFALNELLKHHDLSSDELTAGIVDGEHDGGIDAVYVFLDGVLVQDDHPALTSSSGAASRGPMKPTVEVVIVQAKNTDSWTEKAWEHLVSSLDRLLDNDASVQELADEFRADLVERFARYRTLTKNLVQRMPKRVFKVHYVTRAAERKITPSIEMKAMQVRQVVERRLPMDAIIEVSHIGAEGLYRIAGEQVSVPGHLRFRNIVRERDSYLGVVTIQDYLSFVRDENGSLRDPLFDSNVRDFEGDRGVNSAIYETLQEDGSEFWWQNNGVTVLGTDVRDDQNTLTVAQPLIVNGLQTTHVLHAAERAGEINPARLHQGVIVRVIKTDDEDTRDRVIGGTNRQTPVESVALLASQPLQRDIERFFRANGWYYERRKNQYRNQGKPAKLRVSINQLAQAVMTLQLGLPDIARARPTTLLTQDADRVFDANLDRRVYLASVEMLARVTEFLRSAEAKKVHDEFSNSRFYVLVGAAMLSVGATTFAQLRFDKNYGRAVRGATNERLAVALAKVRDLAGKFQREHPDMKRDSVFKNAEFRKYFLDRVAASSDV